MTQFKKKTGTLLSLQERLAQHTSAVSAAGELCGGASRTCGLRALCCTGLALPTLRAGAAEGPSLSFPSSLAPLATSGETVLRKVPRGCDYALL